MVDLSSLRGFVPQLGCIPNIIYFHENQFAYPSNQQKIENIEPLLVPLYSALCADKIVFNSEYNKTTFIKGANSLFKKLPKTISSNVIKKLENSLIIPVPVSLPKEQTAKKQTSDNLEVIWNHRWEYDKGPAVLLAITKLIMAKSLPIRLHITGERFRQSPIEFAEIGRNLEIHAQKTQMKPGKFGYIKNEDSYYCLLRDCDVVLSTAEHDFQGLAVQEACLAGCTPLAPKALVYPEYLPNQFLYQSSDNSQDTAINIVERLTNWQQLKQRRELPKVNLDRFTTKVLKKEYLQLLGLS